MSEKINVLDVEINELTAKEALRESIRYMESEPVNIIEMVTVDSLMQLSSVQNLIEDVRYFDLMLAGDKTILEAADVTERKILQETENADDMLVNDINGSEVDCVLSALSAPLQEEFIVKNKGVLNARVWLGLGRGTLPMKGQSTGRGRLTRFVEKHIFKKEIEKRKRIDQICAVK